VKSAQARNSDGFSSPETVFQFVPEDSSFTLEIKFNGAGTHSKRDVLGALKLAFDEVKDGQG
jgi:hypothetical protein